MSGNIGGNYEYLIGNYHGLVAEASAGSDSYSFGPGYRFHFAGSMESFFLGIYSRYFMMSGEMTENDGSYIFESAGFAYGANAGKRWVWDNGVNLALRLGGGTANYKTEWKDGVEPVAKGFGDLAIRLVTSIDAELSLGYAF